MFERFDNRRSGGEDEACTEATFVSTGGDKLGSVQPLSLCVQRT
jgi:hypothetical protein